MNNLRSYREREGLSQTELGVRVGLSAVMISGIERGVKDTTGTKWALMADVLGCSVDELLARTRKEKEK